MLKILVIEDNRADREMIKIYLRESSLKHELHYSESLSEGLRIVEEQAINIVLLDLSIVDSSGFNTLRHYLRVAPEIPAVVMTGLNNQKVGLEAVRAGAQDYLVKGDFDSKRLVTSIRHSMERFKKQAAMLNEAETLNEERNHMEAIKNMVVIGDWVMDIVNNSMTWSKELFRIFELPPNSFSPTLSDYLKYVHREDKESIREFLGQAVNVEESGPVEHRIILQNRIIKNLSLRTKMKFDEKTNKVLLLGIVQDITRREEKKEAEEEEANSSQELSTSHLFNQISFNIRTPLSTIVHLLYLLEQTSLSNKQSQLIKDLKNTITDLNFTLSNLVNLTLLTNDNISITQENFRPFELLESIKRVLVFTADQNLHGIDFFIDPRLAISITGDSNQLGQLFFCLSELAFTNSDKDSFIQFRCVLDDEKKQQPFLDIHLEYMGKLPDHLEIKEAFTTDEIMEMVAPKHFSQNRAKLFGVAFYRLRNYLDVEMEIKKSNGKINLDIQIPLTLSKQVDESIPVAPTKATNILLVEDHPMHQVATKQILTTWSPHVSVVISGNGKEAINAMKQEEFNIILMDLQMPVMDGMAASASIRKVSAVPIIALTASTSKQEEERCYELGMNDYLAKPVQPEDLYKRIMVQLHQTGKLGS